jgi:hypothetical protein
MAVAKLGNNDISTSHYKLSSIITDVLYIFHKPNVAPWIVAAPALHSAGCPSIVSRQTE